MTEGHLVLARKSRTLCYVMYVSVADWFGKIVKLSQLAGSAGGCGLHAARRGTRGDVRRRRERKTSLLSVAVSQGQGHAAQDRWNAPGYYFGCDLALTPIN